ncbi:MAG: hypothetical protein NC828_03060 [Candidatus Omnitrophica bacterium]|nr:hypothetical protein [Candidatus Omnitrophota bacterium]
MVEERDIECCPVCNPKIFVKFCLKMNKMFDCAATYGGNDTDPTACMGCPLMIASIAKQLIDQKNLSLGTAFNLSLRCSEEAQKRYNDIRENLKKKVAHDKRSGKSK